MKLQDYGLVKTDGEVRKMEEANPLWLAAKSGAKTIPFRFFRAVLYSVDVYDDSSDDDSDDLSVAYAVTIYPKESPRPSNYYEEDADELAIGKKAQLQKLCREWEIKSVKDFLQNRWNCINFEEEFAKLTDGDFAQYLTAGKCNWLINKDKTTYMVKFTPGNELMKKMQQKDVKYLVALSKMDMLQKKEPTIWQFFEGYCLHKGQMQYTYKDLRKWCINKIDLLSNRNVELKETSLKI